MYVIPENDDLMFEVDDRKSGKKYVLDLMDINDAFVESKNLCEKNKLDPNNWPIYFISIIRDKYDLEIPSKTHAVLMYDMASTKLLDYKKKYYPTSEQLSSTVSNSNQTTETSAS